MIYSLLRTAELICGRGAAIRSSLAAARSNTIRINTWHHHAKCEGVRAIHVIWCDADHDPPAKIIHHVSGKIILERHNANSLNEPWRIVDGSLVLDDDVLRRCEALDAAFVWWTRHPDRRIMGFDARHVPNVMERMGKLRLSRSLSFQGKGVFTSRDTIALIEYSKKLGDSNYNCMLIRSGFNLQYSHTIDADNAFDLFEFDCDNDPINKKQPPKVI
eukprot:scaffold23503_cov35-Cyclotella_meneghiniana.AAC.2